MRGDRRRAGCCLAALIASAAGIARADGPAPPASFVEATEPSGASADALGQPGFLDLIVNTVPSDTVLVRLTPDGDVWVGVDDLERARLHVTGGVRRAVDGRPFVSLRSLGPDLSFELDERNLALRLTAGAALLGRTRFDFRPNARPPGLKLRPAPGAFLNYSATVTDAGDPSGAAELGASTGPGLLLSSFTYDDAQGVIRGLSTVTIDRVDRLQRLQVGDVRAAGDALGGNVIALGGSFARDLSLDPYFVQAPLPTATGFATSPSVVEVWVNGTLVRELPVAPGGYELANIPTTTGANDVRTVLRDAFGRRQETDSTAYLASGQLAKGLRDWSYQAGFAREDYGTESFSYGKPVLMGRYRQGFTEWLTGSLRLEAGLAGDGLVSGGAGAVSALPVGQLELQVAASRAGFAAGAPGSDAATRTRPGAAGLAAYRFASRLFSGTTYLRVESDHYANLSLDPEADRQVWQAGVSMGAPSRWGTLSLSYSAGHPRSGGVVEQGDVRASMPLGGGASLMFSAIGTRGPGRPSDVTVLATVLFSAGRRTLVDTSAQLHASGSPQVTPGASAGIQRSMFRDDTFGYRLRGAVARDDATGAQQSSGTATLQLQQSYGRLEASETRAPDGSTSGYATVSGGLGIVAGKPFLSRPIDSAVALVSVPGVPGVQTYFENQPAGRTDARGDVVVPGLIPYYGHRISIADADVPLGYDVRTTAQTVAAPYRGFTLVRFEAAQLRAVTGTLRVPRPDGVAVSPAYGTLAVDLPDGPASSPVGVDGSFWLERLPAGNHRARVTWEKGTCALTLSVPERDEAILNVGTLDCTPQ